MNLELYGTVLEHALLKNTYQIISSARYLLYPNTFEDVLHFLEYQREKKFPYFVLGNGSNVILDDAEFPGVVLSLEKISFIHYDDVSVFVGAGVMMPKFSKDIIEHGLSGLEWAYGIPGTVGGCIFGNAGAYQVSTFTYLKSVTYIDENLQIVTKNKEELSYGYRTSFFKEHAKEVILAATFSFPYGDKSESLALIQKRLEKRRDTQPLNYPSAGSVFRNPSPDNPSGKIIEDLGLKGERCGGAMISFKHANFIINFHQATGQDIRNLIQLVYDRVKDVGIDLILEQEYKDW